MPSSHHLNDHSAISWHCRRW